MAVQAQCCAFFFIIKFAIAAMVASLSSILLLTISAYSPRLSDDAVGLRGI